MKGWRFLLIVAMLGLFAFSLWNGKTADFPTVPARPAAKSECVLDHCDNAATKPSAVPQASVIIPASEPDAIAPAPVPANLPSRGEAPGKFDFFVLSLSWSSGFCETSGLGGGKAQCDAGSNLGFVVHGLWPQYERGFPSDCGTGQAVSQSALALTRGVFPDVGLARYEWGKHGTCSGWSPDAYFSAVRLARDAIAIPEIFKAPRQEQTFAPNEIIAAFTQANPRLRPGMLAVGCKSSVLQEVRICMSKDLRSFRPCQEVAQQSCHSRDIRVPPVR